MLNDLLYNERYKFILLSGILSVMKEPKPPLLNLFLKSTIINEINHLNNAGLFIQMNDKKFICDFPSIIVLLTPYVALSYKIEYYSMVIMDVAIITNVVNTSIVFAESDMYSIKIALTERTKAI